MRAPIDKFRTDENYPSNGFSWSGVRREKHKIQNLTPGVTEKNKRGELMEDDRIRSLIDTSCTLPPMPMVTTKALTLINDPESSLAELEDVIGKDGNMVSRILNIANSSYYSTLEKIKSIRTAMSLIGYKALGNLVITASMHKFYKKVSLLDKMLWEHSVGTAITAATLSRKFKLMNPDEAMVAGLLHDIGKTIIRQSKSKEYDKIAEKVYNDKSSYFMVEEEILGFTHCDVGSYLVKKWNFPIELGKVIHYHHKIDEIDPERMDTAHIMIIALVDLANQIMHFLGIGYREPEEDVDLSRLKSWQLLGITLEDDDMEDLLEEIKAGVEEEKSKF